MKRSKGPQKRRRRVSFDDGDYDDVREYDCDDDGVVSLVDDERDVGRPNGWKPRSGPLGFAQRGALLSQETRPRGPSCGTQVWSAKHAPKNAQSLVISKPTLNKLRRWFTRALSHDYPEHPRLLLLSGPPGSGKSAAVRVVASELKCNLAEWHAPLPSRDAFTSRALLDSIQEFAIGTRYPSLMNCVPQASGASVGTPRRAFLLDDIPLNLESFSSSSATDQLTSTLLSAAESASCPTIVIVSDSKKARAALAGAVGSTLLMSPNVESINVPAATDVAMKRAIKRVADSEGLELSSEFLTLLVDSSRGDIRSALNSLYVYSLSLLPPFASTALQGSEMLLNVDPSRRKMFQNTSMPFGSQRRKRATVDHIAGVGADATLDTFHAVSKILNNKKLSTGASKYVPEQVLSEARADPLPFVSFLHRNYASFFSDFVDAARALDLVSEAECMLEWRQDDNVRWTLGECGAGVVVRGFLLYNTEPIRSGWRPVRGPDHFAIRRAAQERLTAARVCLESRGMQNLYPSRAVGVDWAPYTSRGALGVGELVKRDGSLLRSVGYDVAPQGSHLGDKVSDSAELDMLVEETGEASRRGPGNIRQPWPIRTQGSSQERERNEQGLAHRELLEDAIADWD